jgi:mono/diheme cytochrome c family protein
MTTKRMAPIWNQRAYAKCLSNDRHSWLWMFITGLVVGGLPAIGPTRASGQDAKSADDPARPFFAKHCQTCHEGKKPKGNFRLESLALDFEDKANRERWLAVLEQVKASAMPPKQKPRPSAQEVQALSDWITAHVDKGAAARNATQGRVVLRRLNRAEYENTVRDLLDVDLDLKDLLAPDEQTNGFDNRAEGLHISSFLIEQYLEAADAVLDAAIASKPRPTTVKKRFDIREEKSVKPKGSVYRHLDDGVAIFSSWASANIQVTLWNFRSRDPGRYRFRISGYGFQTTKPVTFHVMAGTLTEATQQHLVGYFEVPADKPTVVEFVERLEAKNTIRIIVDGLGVTPTVVEKVGAQSYKGPGMNLQWVEIEGPLHDSWPPPSHRRIFGDLAQVRAPLPDAPKRVEVVSKEPLADAERILRTFMRRAFRRTVTDEDVKPFLARVQAKLEAKTSFEQAMRIGLKSVLVSPHFLYLREKPGKLDDFALASRLSYFLWSSMPDEELLTLAEQGKLNDPVMLRRQVERMLRDPKAASFTENFVGQWLNLRAIDATVPDPTLYPEFDEVLKLSMVKEALLFFDEVLKNDLSLTNFVASDFSMLNERLAKHYGIPNVTGREFRKVTLPPNSHRGGVLTMAGVLKVTANGTTTSPILRGAWVLDRILGTPPPRPTVDVEAVEPDIRGATTIREQLAKHRQRAECASCHAKIDPPGFALENFDVIGGWRENYRSVGKGDKVVVDGRTMRYKKGPLVDTADVLPDGRRFKNIDEYKQLLLKDKDQLARALAEKLLSYATGGTPAKSDQPEIEAIVARIRAKHYGLRTLIHEIAQSKVFQHK